MILCTTTPTIEGKTIQNYVGLVHGETIIGTNIFRDIFASITDLVGGRSSAYEEILNKARNTALEEMEVKAKQLGANAIVGIDVDYETIGQGMLMVSISGTAVII